MILPGVNLLFQTGYAGRIGSYNDKQVLSVEPEALILVDDLDVR
jgi:hypothetical protein